MEGIDAVTPVLTVMEMARLRARLAGMAAEIRSLRQRARRASQGPPRPRPLTPWPPVDDEDEKEWRQSRRLERQKWREVRDRVPLVERERVGCFASALRLEAGVVGRRVRYYGLALAFARGRPYATTEKARRLPAEYLLACCLLDCVGRLSSSPSRAALTTVELALGSWLLGGPAVRDRRDLLGERLVTIEPEARALLIPREAL